MSAGLPSFAPEAIPLLPVAQWFTVGGVAVPTRQVVLPWQARGLSYTRTGYGRRIPTTYQIKPIGSRRWRRVYVCIFSNSGTAFIDGPATPDGSRRPWIVVSN